MILMYANNYTVHFLLFLPSSLTDRSAKWKEKNASYSDYLLQITVAT